MAKIPTRTESDTMGPVEVATDRYWGAQAERSLGNFKIGWEKQPEPIIRALGRQAERPFPARRLADGIRHAVEHECQ